MQQLTHKLQGAAAKNNYLQFVQQSLEIFTGNLIRSTHQSYPQLQRQQTY